MDYFHAYHKQVDKLAPRSSSGVAPISQIQLECKSLELRSTVFSFPPKSACHMLSDFIRCSFNTKYTVRICM
ncbi:hypothetical protein TMatcc_001577 [Talaromyces marneffei ATCC 18224]